jgi:hypothetical protein
MVEAGPHFFNHPYKSDIVTSFSYEFSFSLSTNALEKLKSFKIYLLDIYLNFIESCGRLLDA